MSNEEHLKGMYTQTTREIRISVFPEYLPEQSDVEGGRYAFSYSITIENMSSDTVQLINRHWRIYSGGKQYGDVKGDGVVGLQPIIGSGDRFEYTSGAAIKDPEGAMQGVYTFVTDTGDFFDVEVPRFDFVYPALVN